MTRRPDDLPEEWHDTYDDEPSAVSDFEKVLAAVFYTVCAVAFVAIAAGIIAALAAQ